MIRSAISLIRRRRSRIQADAQEFRDPNAALAERVKHRSAGIVARNTFDLIACKGPVSLLYGVE